MTKKTLIKNCYVKMYDVLKQISANSQMNKISHIKIGNVKYNINTKMNTFRLSAEKNLPSNKDELLCGWKVGDLAWGYMGHSPIWPCIISKDHKSGQFVKKRVVGRSRLSCNFFHVTFFDNKRSHYWLTPNRIMQFTGMDDFNKAKAAITPKMRKNDRKYCASFNIKSDNIKNKLMSAVTEAEKFLQTPPELRQHLLEKGILLPKNFTLQKNCTKKVEKRQVQKPIIKNQDKNDVKRKIDKKHLDNLLSVTTELLICPGPSSSKIKEKRERKLMENIHLPKYGKLRVNRPVGNVMHTKLKKKNEIYKCNCYKHFEYPCAPGTNCLNRNILVECSPNICDAEKNCHNQYFRKRLYVALEIFQTENKGWGLRVLEDVQKDTFIIEYVGEVIDKTEYEIRLKNIQNQGKRSYFFSLDKDRIIDAQFKGNIARFVNHSCDPNCEAQNWIVGGDFKIGFFAQKDIPAMTEITINYNQKRPGGLKKEKCLCSSKNCHGYI